MGINFNRNNTTLNTGKFSYIPFPTLRSIATENTFCQVDFRFHLTTEKTVQELLEEKLIEPAILENKENFLVRPKGFDRTVTVTEIVKGIELKQKEIETYFQISRLSQTKKIWKKILEEPTYRKKVFILKLSNGYVYPAPLVKPVLDFGNLEDTTKNIVKNCKT